MAETSMNLGRVSLVPRGAYSPTAQYDRLDIVQYEGASYLARRSVQGVTPTDGEDYMLLAATGTNGTAGAAAGFGTPTATVDANTGTPSVTVTASGPDTAKVFHFEFKNLKGAAGQAGNSISTPVSVSNGGTGQSSLTSGAALVGNGTSAVSLRSITNNTSTSRAFSTAYNMASG